MFLRQQGRVLTLEEMDIDALGIYPVGGWKMQEQNMHSSAKEHITFSK